MVRRRLGLSGPEIAPLGLGCFGLSHAYGAVARDEAIGTIHRAIDLGCRLLDTADIYGAGENERLVGQAIKGRRHEITLATKGGFLCDASGKVSGRNGTPAYLREAVDASLRRLEVDVIDLYTLHRVDPAVPIEESVGAIAELIGCGKIRHLGLSEVSADELWRAYAAHPVTSLQSEYSLWTRGPERDVMPACRELGVSFVAFSPLGRGVFAGGLDGGQWDETDFRRTLPRFQADSLNASLPLIHGLAEIAKRRNLTTSQVALSWILQKGDNVFAIPGTRRQRHLEENVAAIDVTWTHEEIQELDRLFAPDLNFGERYGPGSVFAPR
jgi:aryl-alcohol dehydrogenase-like predicted oxidoreductase